MECDAQINRSFWASSVLLCAFAVALCGCAEKKKHPAGESMDRVYTVTRGDFKVAFRLEGQLDAISSQ